MRLRFGLISNLAFSFVALTVVMQAANHVSDSDFRDTAFRKQEYDRVVFIVQQIEPHIQQEEFRLKLAAAAVSQQLRGATLAQTPLDVEKVAPLLAEVAEREGLDILETTDEKGNVSYRRHGPIGDKERSHYWGTEEALLGTPTTSTAPISEGALIVHSEPIHADARIVGSLTVGRHIGKRFVDALSNRHGSDIALVSRNGKTVASNRSLESAIDAGAITEAFSQKVPVYRFNAARRTTQVYFPLQLVDEGWILLAEMDSSASISARENRERMHALTTFAIVLLSALAMLASVWFALRPLRALRRRAEAVYAEMSGEKFASSGYLDHIDDIDGLVRVLDAQTDLLIQRNQALSEQRADLRISSKAFETQQPTIITDIAGRILKANRAYAQMSGYGEDALAGTVADLFDQQRHGASFNVELDDTLARTGQWQGEASGRRRNGEDYPQKISVHTVLDDNDFPTHRIVTFIDQSEHNNIAKRLQELSLLDTLTRLPNRNLLIDRLRQTTHQARKEPSISALLMIDLDHFKSLNDTQGHAIGDLLIREVGQRLTAAVRTNDTVARIGGDEFAVILDSIAATPKEAHQRTAIVCTKLLTRLRESYALSDSEYRGTCSLGATVFGPNEASAATLMMQADLALHKAKADGRNQICFFDPGMQTQANERVALERSLQDALIQKQFILHFQPQVAASGEVLGVEALIRWQHPERGMVPPGAFIPLAEESGEIVAIGLWVLQSACEQLKKWATSPQFAHLTIAINVCAKQLHHRDFVEQVLSALNESGANARLLKLELTESMVVEHTEELIRKMETLRARGLRFSLDDFGTGYSSLSYLKRLPIEQLKIDQSFVRDVLSDPNDAVIAKSIVGLAHNLGLNVIAEGVETQAQLQFLQEAGCGMYQGYFFSRPLAIDAFEAFAIRRIPAAEAGTDQSPG